MMPPAPANRWSLPRRSTRRLLASLALFLPLSGHAQSVSARGLVTLTSDAEERIRLGQITGRSGTAGYLIRSSSRFWPPNDTTTWSFTVVTPEIRAVRNSGLPYSSNDSYMWAGRGWSTEAMAGIAGNVGPVTVVLAPVAIAEDNKQFQVIPYRQDAKPARSVWANPFHPLPESIDLPLRFGDQRRRRVEAGQSSITVAAAPISFGFATENIWWGPGIRNAITLSSNAGGFPHAFAQLTRPLRSSWGVFDAQWIVGQLSESEFFDADSSNDRRGLAGLAITWSPNADSALTFGISRLVMSARDKRAFPLGAAFDVLHTVGHANADTSTTPIEHGKDQIFSLFGRWVLPESGFEAYAEWARFEEPVSFRDLLEYPGHSQGYTLGVQWAHPLAQRRVFRLQAEASYLEPDPSLRVRPVATTYTSHGVPQGFTQRGKNLGAAIGPGASSQWLAGDMFAPAWRFGVYLSRIRWDNGVAFEPIVPDFKRQDVTLLAGLRANYVWHGVDMGIDFAHAARFDYLYQAFILTPTVTGGIDLINNTLTLTLSTAVWPR